MNWPEHAWLLLLAGCAGGLVFGLTGFAFGVVGSVLLHHTLLPAQVLLVIVGGGFVLNMISLPRFRRLIRWRLAAPFLIGATVGIPIGVLILESVPPLVVRTVAAVLIVLYCLLALLWQSRGALSLSGHQARSADAAVGTVGGVVGGIAGLGPLVPSVWYGLRGWTRDEQRGLIQAYGFYVQGLLLFWLVARGQVSTREWPSLAVAVPGMLLGAWIGARVFDRLPVQVFQKAVIVVCAFGGALLLVRQLAAVA